MIATVFSVRTEVCNNSLDIYDTIDELQNGFKNGVCWEDIIPYNNHKPPKGVPRCIVNSFFLKKILKGGEKINYFA